MRTQKEQFELCSPGSEGTWLQRETPETMQVVGWLNRFYTILLIYSSKCYCSEEQKNTGVTISSLAIPQVNRGLILKQKSM